MKGKSLSFSVIAFAVIFSSFAEAQELPKPSYANATIISIEHSALDSVEVDRIKASIPFGLYAWPSLSMTTLAPALDWHASRGQAADGISGFKTAVDALVAAGKAKKTGIHIVLTSGMARRIGIYREAKEEDVRNAQWFNDNKIASDEGIGSPGAMDTQIFATFSRYARKMRANLEAKTKAALAYLNRVRLENPEVLLNLSGWGEAELSDRRIDYAKTLQDYFCDYSPFAILEFRDWIQHAGLYDDEAGPFRGQGYDLGGSRFQGDLGLADFNAAFETDFATWDLKYFNWSLDDDFDSVPEDFANDDPRRIPFPAYSHGNMLPESGPNFIARGFDPPRTMQPGSSFWDLWNLFRETMVRHFVGDAARWASEAGIPSDRWFSHQIPGDYLYGTKPGDLFLNARYYSSASPLRTAYNPPFGSVGASMYDIKFPAEIFRRTTEWILPDISAMNPNWAILEYDAETYPGAYPLTQSPPEDILAQYLRVYAYRPHLINFWRWIDAGYDHQIEGMNKETALREFVRTIRDKPRNAGLTVVYDPPKLTGLSGRYAPASDSGPAGIEIRMPGTIWPDAPWEWEEWGDFAYFEVYRGASPGFPIDSNHYLGRTSDSIFVDMAALIPSAFYYKARAVNRAGAAGPFSDALLVVAAVAPTALLSVDRNSLEFGAEAGMDGTSGQRIFIQNLGPAGTTLHWTVSSDSAWIALDRSSGAGDGALTVRVLAKSLPPGTYRSRVQIEDAQALLSPQFVDVTLTVHPEGSNEGPFGVFETPVDNSIVSGSIPVTGWALDDIEVLRVEIKRNSHPDDPPAAIGPDGLVSIGDGIFIKGARPDVEHDYSSYPLSDRAGWGYMLLTNVLPNQGNGTFTLHAFAWDASGHRVLLGQKTIVCDNAHAVKPFGTIDTPAQMGIASRNQFVNFGWVLTPQPNMIPVDGSTIQVWVDGVNLGHPTYNLYRSDIAAAFPDLKNSAGPLGYFFLDTTRYANGIHTIAWIAEDDAHNADGIGSRYFSIENTGGSGAAVSPPYVSIPLSPAPVRVRTGFDERKAASPRVPSPDGIIDVAIQELEPVAIAFGPNLPDEPRKRGPNPAANVLSAAGYAGFMKVGDKRLPLPIGSTLDSVRGVFYWMPGPGFLGTYDFVFLRSGEKPLKSCVRIKISPKR